MKLNHYIVHFAFGCDIKVGIGKCLGYRGHSKGVLEAFSKKIGSNVKRIRKEKNIT